MASASSTSAKTLFAESKARLAERVQINVTNIASVGRQIQRGSKTSEIMMHSARNFASQEQVMENSLSNLYELEKVVSDLREQGEGVRRCAEMLEEVKEQTRAMQR